MTSPTKGKDKKKEPAQSKKRQLLNVFHQSIGFLQILTPDELDVLEDKLHIFVFTRGQTLAKEMEPIDYVGVIAEGRAVSKTKNYQIGDTIGHLQVLGFDQKHSESVTGESEGVIIVLRIFDLITLLKPSLVNKITVYLAEVYTSDILKRQQQLNIMKQFDTIDQKRISKYITPEWSQFLNELDFKEKFKFASYFPFYSVKQKDIIVNNHSKGYLLYVVHGQVIAKNKQQTTIIEGGQLYNTEGFLLDQSPQGNVYCLSSEAEIVLIRKSLIEQNFKPDTFKGVIKIVLADLTKKYKKDEEKKQNQDGKEGRKEDEWSIFKKHPDRQILPLPKKSTASTQKNIQKTSNNNKIEETLLVYQTLFRDQLGSSDTKLNTNTSVSDSNYEKLYSLKTEPQAIESYGEIQLQKLRKEVQIMAQKLKFTEQMSISNKLDLIQNRSRLTMGKVFKQIQKLYQQEQVVHQKGKKNEGQATESLVTFKEVFDKQVKENKIRQLVAKYAFRWLYLTRKHKSEKKS